MPSYTAMPRYFVNFSRTRKCKEKKRFTDRTACRQAAARAPRAGHQNFRQLRHHLRCDLSSHRSTLRFSNETCLFSGACFARSRRKKKSLLSSTSAPTQEVHFSLSEDKCFLHGASLSEGDHLQKDHLKGGFVHLAHCIPDFFVMFTPLKIIRNLDNLASQRYERLR